MREINNRGHIATGLLVPSAIAFAFLLIIFFLTFEGGIDRESLKFGEFVYNYQVKEKAVMIMFEKLVDGSIRKANNEKEHGDERKFEELFEEELKLRAEELNKKRYVLEGKIERPFGNIFEKINSGEYELLIDEEIYELKVVEVYFISNYSDSLWISDFDLSAEFTEKGILEVEMIR